MMIFFVYSRCVFKLLFSPAVPLTEQYNREREKKTHTYNRTTTISTEYEKNGNV